MPEAVSQDRRTLLKVIALWMFGAIGVFFAWGAAKFTFFSPGKARVREFSSDVLQKLEPDVPLHLHEPAVWLLKRPEGSVAALDDRCTHLGCRQKWNADRKLFECPCHGSEFDSEGNVQRGPATRPIEKFKTIVEGERIRLASRPRGAS